MVITHKSPNMVEFYRLSCGTVFRDKHSNLCMKIEENNDTNMVYLVDGTLFCIDDEEKVENVRCELVVEN